MELDDDDLELLGGAPALSYWEEQLEVFRSASMRSSTAHTSRMHADTRKDISRYMNAAPKRSNTRARNLARRRALNAAWKEPR